MKLRSGLLLFVFVAVQAWLVFSSKIPVQITNEIEAIKPLNLDASTLPMLNISGFSWAENLAFDGHGNLFVSDATTGMYADRIPSVDNHSAY
jgi:hypothetical protein